MRRHVSMLQVQADNMQRIDVEHHRHQVLVGLLDELLDVLDIKSVAVILGRHSSDDVAEVAFEALLVVQILPAMHLNEIAGGCVDPLSLLDEVNGFEVLELAIVGSDLIQHADL